jgi:excisionase family DNA binding protein
MTADDEWMTTRAVANELGLCLDTVKKMIYDGRLPAYKIGGTAVRVKRADLRNLIERIAVA